jgi:hypothetical protein
VRVPRYAGMGGRHVESAVARKQNESTSKPHTTVSIIP